MHYVDEGDGAPVVLLHGNPTWSFLYRGWIHALAPQRQCIAPDYLGFGRSDKPTDFSYSPRAHAACVRALIERLGLLDLTLVVHDWGGPIGLAYALRRPTNVRRLVLMNTWMWPLDGDVRMSAFSGLVGSAPGRWLIRRFNLLARGMPLGFGHPLRLSRAAYRHYLAPTTRPEERIGQAVFARALLDASAWLEELWQQRERLRSIPTQLIWGMRDPAFGRYLKRWQRMLPHAAVHRLPDVGHFVPEEIMCNEG